MKYLATLGAVCAIGLSAMASQAQAVVYTFTQTGTVSYGIDTKGLFGAAGADLTGQKFSVAFTWDTDDATVENTLTSDLLRQRGTEASANIVIGGVNYEIDVANFGFSRQYITTIDGRNDYTGFSVAGPNDGMNFAVGSKTDYLASVALTAPETYVVTAADRAYYLTQSQWNHDGAWFNFKAETISLTGGAPVSAVPEPASWALMVAGFGLLGGALRARRRAVGEFA